MSDSPKTAKSDRPARKARKPILCDEEWLEGLQKNPAYERLPVAMLYAKMLVWCELKQKEPTRARFVNWLNREEQPMTAAATTNGGFVTRNTTNNRAALEEGARLIRERFGTDEAL